VIVLPAFLCALLLYAAAHAFAWPLPAVYWRRRAGRLRCALRLHGHGYACIKFLQEWASPLTLVNFALLGCASGTTLAAAIASVRRAADCPQLRAGGHRPDRARLVTRAASLARNARLRRQVDAAERDRHQASAHRAEGAGLHGRLVQHARVLSRRVAAKLIAIRRGFLIAAFALPVLLLAVGLCDGRCGVVRAGVCRAIRGLARRALVLLRAGEPPAEPVLPGDIVKKSRGLLRPRLFTW
jgi:hypothetical protein